MTYYAFLSLFPLLLLLSTTLGLVLSHDPALQKQVLASALGQFPVIGKDLGQPGKIGGGSQGLVIGILASLYGALGVAQAIQNVMNTAWTVPRNVRPNPFKARARSVVLLGTVGLAVLATTVLTAIASGAGGIADQLGVVFQIGVLASAVTVNTIIFALAFRIATARSLSLRDVAPGALVAAAVWQGLQAFGAAYVRHVSHTSSETNGAFGVVLGLIAFLYLASALVVLCVEINVVRVDHLHPRALLTPFTATTCTSPTLTEARTPTRPRPNKPKASSRSTSAMTSRPPTPPRNKLRTSGPST